MKDVLVKGWCPTLARPMETGDGLLVRLHIKYGILSSEKARVIVACAEKYGNGHMDMTSRCNLQFRGVTQESYEPLVRELSKAGFADEPRPERVATPNHRPPLGYLDSRAIGLGLAFGRLEVATLDWLADSADGFGNGIILLSAWRAVFLPEIKRGDAERIMADAGTHGFIIDKNDALRAIHTCPGAPACSSAQGKTRALALALAQIMPDLVVTGKTVHVSGCAKGCACAEKSSLMVTARRDGYDVSFDAIAGTEPVHSALNVQQVMDLAEAL